MADNFGVLGGHSTPAIGDNTVYICPANKAAKVKIIGTFQANAALATGTLAIVVNNIVVAQTAAMAISNWTFTNGGAGLLRAPSALGPTGQSAAETAQPGPPIYYLSAGQSIKYNVGVANLQFANMQVVGIEVDLTL